MGHLWQNDHMRLTVDVNGCEEEFLFVGIGNYDGCVLGNCEVGYQFFERVMCVGGVNGVEKSNEQDAKVADDGLNVPNVEEVLMCHTELM